MLVLISCLPVRNSHLEMDFENATSERYSRDDEAHEQLPEVVNSFSGQITARLATGERANTQS